MAPAARWRPRGHRWRRRRRRWRRRVSRPRSTSFWRTSEIGVPARRRRRRAGRGGRQQERARAGFRRAGDRETVRRRGRWLHRGGRASRSCHVGERRSAPGGYRPPWILFTSRRTVVTTRGDGMGVRRVVTGHDANGTAVVVTDEVVELAAIDDHGSAAMLLWGRDG